MLPSPLRFFRRGGISTFALILAFVPARADDAPIYPDKSQPLETRVADLLDRLTIDEKITLLAGKGDDATQPVPRLNIPPMVLSDAGAGIRGIGKSTQGPATNFSCGVMMGATWDPELVGRVATAIGEEARNKGGGTQIVLGPAVNIQRSPLGGRNGEYFSEDPFLAGRMAVGYIEGLQRAGIGACLKHFACNNEEADRRRVDVHVSERALREIYFPAFEAGVTEAHSWALMSSYNRVNGRYSSANAYLLTDVLRKGWGFDGMVMSDWGGVHQCAASINAGNDLQMPEDQGPITPDHVHAAWQDGQLTSAGIDAAARRIVRTMLRTGLLDAPWKTDPAQVNSMTHAQVAREVAEKGMVLLKNENAALPLDAEKIHTLVLIGPAAQEMQMGALGSPEVHPALSVGPLDGITRRAGEKISVKLATGGRGLIPESAFVPAGATQGHGLQGDYFSNQNLEGQPLHTRIDPTIAFDWAGAPNVGFKGIGPEHFSVRWSGKLVPPYTGHYKFFFSADDGCRLFLNGKLIIDHWVDSAGEPQTAEADLVGNQPCDFVAEYYQNGLAALAKIEWEIPQAYAFKDAIDAAHAADAALVFVSTERSEGEGHDRPNMNLPADQDGLIAAVAKANPRTIVVLNNGTPVDMRAWIASVPAVLEAWFPGQQGGEALAAILFGDVNPSGKLPTTFGLQREDYPDYGNFPGARNRVDYAEGIYVGYRHFDQANLTPLFPFGHGLSYTTFDYGAPELSAGHFAPGDKFEVKLSVKNTGSRAGAEVAQLYLHDPAPKIDKPARELKRFCKLELAPGESKTVTLSLSARDFAYFDTAGKQWKADAGDYEIQLGSSSRDIRQKAKVHLDQTWTESVPLSRDLLAENGGFSQKRDGDLAMNRPTEASSQAPDFPAPNAVDSNDTTAWKSDVGNEQWIKVDLGSVTSVNRIRIFWGDAYALGYSVAVSTNGQQWNDVFETRVGEGDVQLLTFDPLPARYVRVLATRPATPAGYSIASLEVYGPTAK